MYMLYKSEVWREKYGIIHLEKNVLLLYVHAKFEHILKWNIYHYNLPEIH